MDLLTNDAKYLLSSMYKVYIDRRKSGILKKDAVFFENLNLIQSEIMSEWKIDDVFYTCMELKKHKLIMGKPASGTMICISLTTEAIASLETTFKDKADQVLNYANKIKNLIPFI
ncbi:hypothetical protein [Rummeliibacillus suwonensis]|uniref:hypothetical protein n=1 Tax=Rummeliibacillus suwonensis TaxID=1306154 RepID=UPI00289FE6F7|nr:hypothetical protein [Rummeliibacillus suwonensis]